MIQIRAGVFETNSSSMHSLVMMKDGGYCSTIPDYLLDKDGVWDIYREGDLVFGCCPFQCLCTFEEKVRYAIASLCSYRKDAEKKFREIEAIVNEIRPECTGIKLPYNRWSDETSYGHVDEDKLTGFLKKYNISLKEFFTDKKYVVIVDGDEYCIFDNLKASGLVNFDKIEEEYC